MRPDLDDFEELNEEGAPRSRAMSWLVLVVAVGGFAALAYYAYHSGTQSIKDGQVMVVQADGTPIKAQPADAEGEQFPNKDKTIYDAIGADDNGATTEKLLPEAEQPVIPEAAVEAQPAESSKPAGNGTAATTFVNKSVAGSTTPVDPVDAQSMKQGGPEAVPASKTAAAAPAKPAAAPVATSEDEDEEDDAASTAPAFVNVKPAKAAPAPAAKPAEKAAAKPAAKPAPKAASGNYQVQLGAFKSEDEARAQWSKIAAKSGGVVSGSPIIVKADLPNGTFYRLRAGGFASPEAAKSACAKLSAKGQACFYAGK
jgi:cell division protein FtsN